MEITVNGKALTLPENVNITGLLDNLSIDPARSVIEVNGVIVMRSEHAMTVLFDGDLVEIVRFVGGG